MRIRSLALKTELGLAATNGQLLDRGDYVVVRTPGEPGYYFGNFLVLGAPPRVGEVGFWARRFADEFRDDAAIRHVAFRWESTHDAGPLDEFRAAGIKVENDCVLTATVVEPASTNLPIRALGADEMQLVADLRFALSDDHGETFRQFLDRRALWKASLVERGLGAFFGAFDGAQLVGSLGIVKLDRLARYQSVQVVPTHRKRGIASALLATAAARFDVERYVIVAEPDSEASGVYARAGFGVVERMVSAFSAPASR